MPKIRRERTKYHDLAPHSRRLQSGEESAAPNAEPASPAAEARLEQLRQTFSTEKSDGEQQRTAAHSRAAHGSGRQYNEAVSKEKIDATLEQSFLGLSRGQRRRLAKREAWLRKFDFAGYAREVKAQKQKEENARAAHPLFDFGTFRSQLETIDSSISRRGGQARGTGGDVAGPERKGTGKISRKTFQRVTQRELQQYDAVLNFPAFQESPLAALKLHIENTLNLQKQMERGEGPRDDVKRKTEAAGGKQTAVPKRPR
ncbi:conserved hypothetical protein [Neospora caninum Liverpool]|uniref:Uncharacterized protein n=1 Tax=Neospora caninum (strain Liverpool) TaxID=572307 RepID=F0V8Z9_NEOCL|nr:conserved hypothetical protein [Neospora caninum Liverpool]CBZ50190.1 conserved hypothetical protein [Neospora caninum Liverpool]CEL64792.1 TPA: hypothetical protein BN1204_006650 [Neospora caninum Liverpool]|eukprot:XP_003880225.1 conserved hypothetical protein [Neospora caninum Liverpool]